MAPPGAVRLPNRWAAFLSLTIGVGGWLEVSALTGRREAWDSELYFSLFFPLLLLLSAILGWLAPDRAWRWGLWMAGGQFLAMFADNPGGNLLPLGVITFGVLGGITGLPGVLAARLRARLDARQAPS
jgi:hypothetical protein